MTSLTSYNTYVYHYIDISCMMLYVYTYQWCICARFTLSLWFIHVYLPSFCFNVTIEAVSITTVKRTPEDLSKGCQPCFETNKTKIKFQLRKLSPHFTLRSTFPLFCGNDLYYTVYHISISVYQTQTRI